MSPAEASVNADFFLGYRVGCTTYCLLGTFFSALNGKSNESIRKKTCPTFSDRDGFL